MVTSHSIVDDIKNKLDIVDVIGKSISLHKESNGLYAGATSPSSKSGASLKVDYKIQSFYNFADGIGGDVLDAIGYFNGGLDTRGRDFPVVLRMAAEMAGIELEKLSESERSKAKEKADIHNLFTEAAEIYHKNLTPEIIKYICNKWHITEETIEKYKIGYARLDRNLKDLDPDLLKKSGLVYVNDGRLGGEVFRGRIIFPYWRNGKVVYFVGRSTDETPLKKDGSEPSKYKKLLVYNEKNNYVSPLVQNSYFYGEDSLRGQKYCIITEGVADCISLLQNNLPSISPVTVNFSKHDYDKLVSLTKGLTCYICNDNEESQAGLKGTLKTAHILERAGIEARVIQLPRDEGLDKIDIADYLKTYSIEDFKKLLETSERLWAYKLKQLVIPANFTSLERLKLFRKFISDDLEGMSLDEWSLFVSNEVLEKFKLKSKEVKKTIEEISKKFIPNENIDNSTDAESQNSQERSQGSLIEEYGKEIVDYANYILEHSDPFLFIHSVWNRLHVGDKNIGENLLCSIACTQIKNAKIGLHMKPSGDSGTGKSDAIFSMLRLLPRWKYLEGSISSKVLFYDKSLRDGTIIYTDDVNLSPDVKATLRAATSDYQAEAIHRTLTGELEVNKTQIPKRVTFWFSCVDSLQDNQLESRFFFGDTDGSAEQDKRVNKKQKERVTLPYDIESDPEVLTCRCIFDVILKNEYYVFVPFADAIEWNDMEHRRNFDKFLDLILAVTIFNVFQREKVYNGIVSTLEDYHRAIAIYNGTSANNATNLNGKEMEVMKVIQVSPNKTISFLEILEKTGIKETSLRYLLDGRNGSEGLLGKVKGLSKIDKSDSISSDDGKIRSMTKGVIYRYSGDLFSLGSKLFQSVSWIDESKASRLTSEFMTTALENTNKNHMDHMRITNFVSQKNSSSSSSNSNNNTIITNNREIERENIISSNTENIDISNGSQKNISLGGFVSQICEPTEENSPLLMNHMDHTKITKITEHVRDIDFKCEPCEPSVSQDNNIYEVVNLLKKTIENYARQKYKKPIIDIEDFIICFIRDNPVYLERLNENIIRAEIIKLHNYGRI